MRHKRRAAFIIVALFILSLAINTAYWLHTDISANTSLGFEYKQTPLYESDSYQLVDDYCVYWQCFFEGNHDIGPVGIGVVKGYYTPRPAYSMGGEEIVCDGFTIIDAPKSLTQILLKWIKDGNTVNGKNNLNQPIVNVDMASLTPTDRQHLLLSKLANPIQFIVLRRPPSGKGAPDCYPVLDFLTEKNAPVFVK